MPGIDSLINMRQYFETGITRTYEFRKSQLLKLRKAVLQNESALHEALYVDLKKSPEECWVTETGFVVSEISNALNNLRAWMDPEKVKTNLLNLPSKCYVVTEPLGVVLIISPWNYPLQLLFTPLAGAIAAGNCIVLKPSEFAPATSVVMKKIIEEIFDSNYISYVEGDGAVIIPGLVNNFIFDHLFYTGSTAIGKLVYQMAAKNLVPVTLELGGKSPCVVEADANVAVASRRIVSTKFSNAGQMCVAPDYLLVHRSKKEELLSSLGSSLSKFYGANAADNNEYGKIINEKQFDRLCSYLGQGKIIYGGKTDREKLYIEPTIMDEVALNSPIMQEEIFGPVLPVIAFDTTAEALAIIALNKNPLAFYIFTSSSKKEAEWINSVPFGCGCVNNAAYQLTNHNLPFGGRGNSGSGNYHGKYSFDTFSHKKGIMKTPTWFDPSVKYPPFKGKLKLFKWIIK